MSEKRKRRTWQPEEKLRILQAGMEPGGTVSELCRREGIQPAQYHAWRSQLLSSAAAVFGDRKKNKREAFKEQQHEEQLRQKDAVIAEITAENLTFKKNALGLEDYGQLPPELQQQVVAAVEQAKSRSKMSLATSFKHLGVSRSTYFRWRQEQRWRQEKREPTSPIQAFEALDEEKQAVVDYALKHPEIRHRELSWRMIDDDVAHLSTSTVYRILKGERLMCERPGRKKRYRDEIEKARRPDQIWATDLMYLTIGESQYYLLNFIDEYSRYLVHWELLSKMDGHSISIAAQRALETLAMNEEGQVTTQPIIRSDNGSGYISREFGGLLAYHGLTHHRIKPHCPEENGVMERCNRTLREAIEVHEFLGRFEAEEALHKIIDHYNTERLHSALNFQKPATWYRGNPEAVAQTIRSKLSQARHRRKQFNLGIRQRILPYPQPEIVTCN